MRFKELIDKVDNWGKKHNVDTLIKKGEFNTIIKAETNYKNGATFNILATISNNERLKFALLWEPNKNITIEAKDELFEIIVEFAKTWPNNREGEGRFIIPLPNLKTTDGEQQYLTQNGSFFASRRDNELKQIWAEKDLKYIPEEYKKYAIDISKYDDWKFEARPICAVELNEDSYELKIYE